MAKAASKHQVSPRRVERWGFALLILLVIAGIGISALERYQPEVIEPLRHRISIGLSRYFHPLLETSQEGRRLIRKVSELWGVESDYRRLERELTQTRLELQLAREQLRSLSRISGLRRWKGPEALEFELSEVIGFSIEGSSAEWIINRGSFHGMEVGLPVVGQNGLAGVIREVSDRTSRVQALTDPLSAVGVADADRRTRGIVFGSGRDLPLEYLPENESEPILPGTTLITSGFQNSVYPKGIVVGEIKAKRRNYRGAAYGVVAPAESFNALEEVLVVTRAPGVSSSGPLDGLGLYSFDIDPEGDFREDGISTDTLSPDPAVGPSSSAKSEAPS